MARLTPARALLLAIAACALAPAACSSKYSSPTPKPVNTSTPQPGLTSTPAPSTEGLAYIPDGGNGGPFGLTVAHYLNSAGDNFHYFLEQVNFGASVKPFSVSADSTLGLAGMQAPSGQYSYLQGVLGIAVGNPIPGGPPYDTSIQPTTAPSSSPPPPDATIPSVTSVAILSNGDTSVGLAMGPGSNGILGVNQVVNQTPTFNGFIPYTCGGTTISPSNGRQNIIVSSTSSGSGVYTALVRGPNDLVAFAVTPNFTVNPPIYVFCVKHQDTTLGSRGALEGRGGMAISPQQPGRAIVVQSSKSAISVNLVTNMPQSMTLSSTVNLTGASRANAVAVHPGGLFAVVGGDTGLFVFKGINGTSLSPVPQGAPPIIGPYHPSYIGADKQSHKLENVTSVGFSGDGTYITALCSTTPNAPGGGTTASFIVMPFNETSGVISAPVVVDNGLVTPAFYQDFMVSR